MMRPMEGSAGERAYHWTRGRILDATFAPSTMITEGEIAALVGVSRTPVREAFLRLAGEGFLRLYPKRGAMVVPVTEADMREVLEARLLVEPWAAAVAARRADHHDLARTLDEHVRALEAAARDRDAAAYQDSDRAFHVAIVEATQNRLLAEFYRGLRDRQLRVGAAALAVSRDRDRTILSEHRAIVEAIATGDPELAASTVRDHVRSTQAALRLPVGALTLPSDPSSA
jgi:DNA-binding GntR family transcriptional regulator